MSWFNWKPRVANTVITPAPLSDVTSNSRKRISEITASISEIDKELRILRNKVGSSSCGIPQNHLKRQAIRLIQQKQMYEQQIDILETQIFNVEKLDFTSKVVSDTITTTKAIKQASNDLKAQLSSVDSLSIKNDYDEMAELLEEFDSLQLTTSRTFGGDYDNYLIDDDELAAEFDNLGVEEIVGDNLEQLPTWLVHPLPHNTITKPHIITNGEFPQCPIEHIDNLSGELLYDQPVEKD